jgi:hypothetical protein
MVAEYDNVPLTRTRQDKNGNPFEGKIRLRYNTSWNWLLPVWAKVDSSLPSILNSLPNGKRIQLRDSFNKLDERYYKAVRANNITEAFNVVCDAIILTTKP